MDTQTRKPGSVALAYGLGALALAAFLFVVGTIGGRNMADNPLLGLLLILSVGSGLVAVVIGGIRRLLAT